jgi:hypothetical protein
LTGLALVPDCSVTPMVYCKLMILAADFFHSRRQARTISRCSDRSFQSGERVNATHAFNPCRRDDTVALCFQSATDATTAEYLCRARSQGHCGLDAWFEGEEVEFRRFAPVSQAHELKPTADAPTTGRGAMAKKITIILINLNPFTESPDLHCCSTSTG